MAARPTPSKQGNTKRSRSATDDDSSGSVRTAPHTLPFDERKPAFLRAMYYKREEIFAHHELFLERVKYVNGTIGETYKVALTGDAAVAFLEEYRNSANSLTDLNKYMKAVNVRSILIEDREYTYEELLLKQCEDKSSKKPWDGLVVRDIPTGSALEDIADKTKVRNAISLYGSSGCGKSEALKAVAEYVIQKHCRPNVVHLQLDWKDETDLRNRLAKPGNATGNVQPRTGGPIPSNDKKRKKMSPKTAIDWERDCLVAQRLLGAVDSHVKRTIDEEVERGATLPDPAKFALVVTQDEIGTVPTSARALVSISRQLNGDERTSKVPPAVRTLRKVFSDVVIVLAGTTGETMTGGVGGSDPTKVCSVNLDDAHCKNAITGRELSREEYREALVYAHLPSHTHGPWLAPRLLKSRLRLALDNPRVVYVLGLMTRLVPPSTSDLSIQTEPTVLPARVPNPLSLHEFDQWAPLLANAYCKLNGLSDLEAIAADPRAYSERLLWFLRAHYVWDYGAEMKHVLDGLLAKEGKPNAIRSKEEDDLAKLQRKGLVTFTRDDNAKGATVSGSEPCPSYRVSIPPSLPYIALAALDCTAGFGGGGWSAWECVAMQSVGLRYAAAMAWKGCATVGDAVPGLYVPVANNVDPLSVPVPDKDTLAWHVASVENTGRAWEGRHWCAMLSPIQLCGYAPKEFNEENAREQIQKNNKSKDKELPEIKVLSIEAEVAQAKEVFDATQATKKQSHDEKVKKYWRKKVLPLLEKHSIVLVQNAEKAPAADCFALIRVNRMSGGKPSLLVAQLQMKDLSYSTAPNVDEEMAKMGYASNGNAEVKSIVYRADAHFKIMQDAFPQYNLYFGAVICMSRAAPEPTSEHNWKSLAKLQELFGGTGVMYATPVQQCVFYPKEKKNPKERKVIRLEQKKKKRKKEGSDDTEGAHI